MMSEELMKSKLIDCENSRLRLIALILVGLCCAVADDEHGASPTRSQDRGGRARRASILLSRQPMR